MTDPRKAHLRDEPAFAVQVQCNICQDRFFMYPRGDEEDSVMCSCGRVVVTKLENDKIRETKPRGKK